MSDQRCHVCSAKRNVETTTRIDILMIFYASIDIALRLLIRIDTVSSVIDIDVRTIYRYGSPSLIVTFCHHALIVIIERFYCTVYTTVEVSNGDFHWNFHTRWCHRERRQFDFNSEARGC